MSDNQKYTTFSVPKKRGGVRQISSPVSAIKIIQNKLNQVLSAVYQPKPSAHGFLSGRSILTNAASHVHRRYILNVDIEGFFPVSTLAECEGCLWVGLMGCHIKFQQFWRKSAVFDNQLPQGAPTSPIVANMICENWTVSFSNLHVRGSVYTRVMRMT